MDRLGSDDMDEIVNLAAVSKVNIHAVHQDGVSKYFYTFPNIGKPHRK
jgi:hypothetical protein